MYVWEEGLRETTWELVVFDFNMLQLLSDKCWVTQYPPVMESVVFSTTISRPRKLWKITACGNIIENDCEVMEFL